MTAPRAAGDHYSAVSATYAAYRPRYPRALFDQLAALTPRHRLAWDCAAGNGQATLDLAERFERVIATDASAQQIARAPAHPRITWHIATAEASGITSDTVDLVTVAQALHWFDQPAFFAEARRVAAPDGVVAVWSYGSPELDGEAGAVLSRHEHETVGAYWPKERALVYQAYSSVDFPFEPLPLDPVRMEAHWTLDQLLGYVRSWSATSRYVAANRDDPTVLLENALQPLWRDRAQSRLVRWPLTILAGRVHGVHK